MIMSNADIVREYKAAKKPIHRVFTLRKRILSEDKNNV